MKDYKRLTNRDLVLTLNYNNEFEDDKRRLGYALRLWELENRIESGELDYVADRDTEIARLTAKNVELRERLKKAVVLPCKVGDTVYCIRDLGLGNYRIIEKTVSEIAFDYNNQMRIKTPYGLFDYEKWTYGLDCFADCVAAKAHLKELEGGMK